MATSNHRGGITAGWRTDPLVHILALYLLVSAGRLLLIAAQPGGDLQFPLAKILAIALSMLACAALFLAARRVHVRAISRALFVMGLAVVANLAGNLLYLTSGLLLGEVPFPSVADPVYLVGYPLMLVAVLLFPRRQERVSERLKLWLDVATTVVGGGMVFWYFLIFPIASSAQPSFFASVFAVAYPVADLVLLVGMATVFLRASATLSRLASLLIGSGIALYLFADAVYSYLNVTGLYVDGTVMTLWCEVPYQTALFVMAFAAYVTTRPDVWPAVARDGGTHTGASISPLPYVSVVAGYGMLLAASITGADGVVTGLVLGAVLLTALVLLRQIAAIKEVARMQAERASQRIEARFRSLVQRASDVVTVLDDAGRVTYQTPSSTRVFGVSPEAMMGEPFVGPVHPDDRPLVAERIDAARAEVAVGGAMDWRLARADGTWRHIQTVITDLRDDPEVAGLVLTSRDDTERRSLAELLRFQAFHDRLTGLLNRDGFEERVAQTLHEAQEMGLTLAILFLDLDNFKTVNDSLGHGAGDAVLAAVATRLRAVADTADTVARFGGDEFAVLLTGVVSAEEPVLLAERLLEVCRQPIAIQGREIVVGCSIGVALSGADGGTADEVLRNADVAMYIGKEKGKGRYELFETEMHTRIVERLELEADLHAALGSGELVVHYQPIVALETGAISGVEALVRWQHPRRGLLLPGAFISLAEASGLIVPLGLEVLRQACHDGRQWQLRYPAAVAERPLSIKVNLSIRQLEHPDILADVQRALDASGLPAASLVLEITESVAMGDPEAAIARLAGLKRIGVRIALDDFGTGFSSLSYLQRLPVDILKIDQSFVGGLTGPGGDTSLVAAILAISRSLRLTTIAEGIEQADQLEGLRQLGCPFGQGYLLGRPAERALIDDLLRCEHARQDRPLAGAVL